MFILLVDPCADFVVIYSFMMLLLLADGFMLY